MNKKTIKEICLKLNIGIASIHDVFLFYELFNNSTAHSFSNEVIVASAIFVSCKISENPKRIRDIINVLYLVKNKYKILDEEDKGKENKELIELLKKDDFFKKETIIKTMYAISLTNYRILKEEILAAEQHLLRLMSFSFKKMSKFVLIEYIKYSEFTKLNKNQMQLGWDILLFLYEDLSAYELNTNETLIICIIIDIVIGVCNTLVIDETEKGSEMIKEQKKLLNELKAKCCFNDSQYNSFTMVVLNNYYKTNSNDNNKTEVGQSTKQENSFTNVH